MMAPCSWREASEPGRTSSISRDTWKMWRSDSWLNCWLLTTCRSGSACHSGAVRFSSPGSNVLPAEQRGATGTRRPRGCAALPLQEGV